MSVMHTYISGAFGERKTKRINPCEAIRAHCKECYGFCANVSEEIRNCPSEECPLWPYRFGRDPGTKRTKKQIKAAINNLRAGQKTENMGDSQG